MAGRIVCFGELLLRLGAPERGLLLQQPRLDVHVGGAEANVAVSLAKLGHDAAVVSVVPPNALGDAAVGELKRHGVDTSRVARAPGRMGLYFLATGAGHRSSEVLYDRAHSSFASTPASAYDWPTLLAGADALHVSGVTPALGAECAAATLDAMRAARAAGLAVSFDGNFRAKLWAASGGDAPAILRQVFAHADIAFADARDLAMALGRDFGADPVEAQAHAARAAFEAFPQLQRIATTLRVQHSVDHHELSATMHARAAGISAPRWPLTGIVDRIGGGDAFAAGVLHVLRNGGSDGDALHFGLAAACLKHAIPGDFNLAGADEIRALLGERRYDVRR